MCACNGTLSCTFRLSQRITSPSALALPCLLTLPVGSFKPASPKLEEASLVILL